MCRNGQTRAESLAGSCLRQGWPLLETRGRSRTPCSREGVVSLALLADDRQVLFFEGQFRQCLWLPQRRAGPGDIPPPGLERVVPSGRPVCAAYPLDSPRASALGAAYFSKPWSGRDAFTPVVVRSLERTEDTLQRHRNSVDSGCSQLCSLGLVP